MFSHMKRPEINPVWSSFIIYGTICLSFSLMHADVNLYDIFSKDIGLQFFHKIYSYFLWASMLSLRVLKILIVPFRKADVNCSQ